MFNFLLVFIKYFVSVYFVFGYVLLTQRDCVLGFSFDLLVFKMVSIKVENGFQKNNLPNFNLGLIWSEYRGTFFYMQLIWCC